MKRRAAGGPRERTRRAILEATADVVTETNGVGFSVQAVADRAGVTHRTVYNYFPTREALCEAFSSYVDESLASTRQFEEPPRLTVEALPSLVEDLYRTLEMRQRYVRAYVMLTLANRRPVESWRSRTQALEKQLARKAGPRIPLAPRQVAAAIRLFASSLGWHLLTEQCGLSTREAAATSAWAAGTLLEAATGQRTTSSSSPRSPGGANATRRRRK